MPLVTRFAGADEVALSQVIEDGGYVRTLSGHDWGVTGERYALADYPATKRVIGERVVGQIVAGDPEADPAEIELLQTGGHQALLMAPIVHRGRTVGLVEFYRNEPRPWTTTEIDHLRMLAHHLGPTIVALEPAPA
jgi:GAF domain-containing protein